MIAKDDLPSGRNPTVPSAHLSALLPETLIPSNEPASVPQHGTPDAGSPSTVRQHEVEMTLLLTKINQELPDALTALQQAKDRVRRLKLEKTGAERLLATHRRIREPHRRVTA